MGRALRRAFIRAIVKSDYVGKKASKKHSGVGRAVIEGRSLGR